MLKLKEKLHNTKRWQHLLVGKKHWFSSQTYKTAFIICIELKGTNKLLMFTIYIYIYIHILSISSLITFWSIKYHTVGYDLGFPKYRLTSVISCSNNSQYQSILTGPKWSNG